MIASRFIYPLSLRRLLFLPAFFVTITTGCAYYSFTGASIPSHLSSIAIPLVEDNSTSPVTTLSQDLTRLLTDRFVGQTRLTLEPEEEEASAVLTARIDRYTNAPASVSAQEVAELNRVSITVSVTYFDRVENKNLLERQFSAFGEYNPSAGLSGEAEAANQALTNIADEVFSTGTSNW